MARETKEQRQDREMREAAERCHLLQAEWSNRVLVELERASNFDFEIKVVKKTDDEFAFVVKNPRVKWMVFNFGVHLPEKQDMTDIYSLEDLQNELNIFEQKVSEEDRKRKLKENPLYQR